MLNILVPIFVAITPTAGPVLKTVLVQSLMNFAQSAAPAFKNAVQILPATSQQALQVAMREHLAAGAGQAAGGKRGSSSASGAGSPLKINMAGYSK
mmetsp:Transcript_47750/g.132597  ORF Transcript_47750/g.132597 Transcript_47750/m.132597 type:complete len:96 (+) Transcript_47750:5859-6146(+)